MTTTEISPSGTESPLEDRFAGETKQERIGRYVFLFLFPFLMVTMMYATYMGTMHEPTVHDLPVVVAGEGEAAESMARALRAVPDDALDVRVVGSVEQAETLMHDREVAGAVVLGAEPGVAEVLTASAGGASQASVVQQTLAPVVAAQGRAPEVRDVAPLPEGDGSGTAPLFAAIGLMLAGYVPLSTMLMAMPYVLRVRRFVPLALLWSAFTSSVVWLIMGPVVGAVEGHYLAFLGVGVLATMGVGLFQLFLSKVLGPFAVLLGMLLWMVLGMPSSNLALSVHSMPGFYGWLHGVLPLPAAGETMRSILYFDAEGIGGHLLTLGLWAAAGLLLSLLWERKRGHVLPGAPVLESPADLVPAFSGSPDRSARFRHVAVPGFALAILVTVVGLMSFSMHTPEVRDMPVAVLGADAAQTEQAVAGMAKGFGDMLDLRTVSSTDEALERIEDRDVVAAYVLPGVDGATTAKLYTASGGGMSQSSAAQGIFGAVAGQSGVELVVEDVNPLTDSDLQGSNSMYAAMSWMMCGFLFLAVMRGGAPELTRFRQLLPFIAGWSVGMAVWLWFLFDVLIGAINGASWTMIGFGSLAIFSAAVFSAAFIRLLGIAAIIPVMVVLMLAGVPASGGGLSIYMVPELFRWLGDVLPMAAAVDVVRSAVYFDGAGLGASVVVVSVWALVGIVANLAVDRVVNRPTVTDVA